MSWKPSFTTDESYSAQLPTVSELGFHMWGVQCSRAGSVRRHEWHTRAPCPASWTLITSLAVSSHFFVFKGTFLTGCQVWLSSLASPGRIQAKGKRLQISILCLPVAPPLNQPMPLDLFLQQWEEAVTPFLLALQLPTPHHHRRTVTPCSG